MIGVFDSGVGGLTILKELLKKLPDYDYIYYGDNARSPYGSKSQELIYSYAKEAVNFLFAQGCNLIIVACNSASAKAVRKIQQEYLPTAHPDKRVLGVVRPIVQAVAANKDIKRVGILGTRATVDSEIYQREINELNPELEIYQQAAPLLVPLIEEGWLKKPETISILKKYLRPLKNKQVEILIPACTHYPFLQKEIKKIMTKRCLVLNPGEIVVDSLSDYLNRHLELNVKKSTESRCIFYTTDDIAKFKNLGEKFLGRPMSDVKKI